MISSILISFADCRMDPGFASVCLARSRAVPCEGDGVGQGEAGRDSRTSVELRRGEHAAGDPGTVGEKRAMWEIGQVELRLKREQDLPVEAGRVRSQRIEVAFVAERDLARPEDARAVVEHGAV